MKFKIGVVEITVKAFDVLNKEFSVEIDAPVNGAMLFAKLSVDMSSDTPLAASVTIHQEKEG